VKEGEKRKGKKGRRGRKRGKTEKDADQNEKIRPTISTTDFSVIDLSCPTKRLIRDKMTLGEKDS
jgi:hypothetical protein